MKKILSLIAIFALVFTSCKNKDKKKDAETTATIEKTYTASADGTTIGFTAYKTTDKTPVGGKFTLVKLKNAKSAATAIEALDNLEFSIPVSSLFTKDTLRDGKLKKFFFGVMDQAEMISGTFKFDAEKKCTVSLKMNGVTTDLPLAYTVTDKKRVNFTGVMNLENWNALDAVASLSEVCFDLHKGADGVSKTWTEVAIEASTVLKEN